MLKIMAIVMTMMIIHGSV